MKSSEKQQLVGDTELNNFLLCGSSTERISTLEKWKKSGMTLDDSILRGMIKLPIPQDEIISALEICTTQNSASFELWIMDNLLTWDQNIAAIALRAWARNTDCILWHRLIPMAMFPGLPQRIRYTILDIATASHGYEIVKATLNCSDWEDLSSAFHALLFERSIQYHLSSSRLTTLAWKIVGEFKFVAHPEHKALFPAFAWLCKSNHKELKKWCDSSPQSLWKSALETMIDAHEESPSQITKLEKSIGKSKSHQDILSKIPAIWSRESISEVLCDFIFSTNYDSKFNFHGFSQEALTSCLNKSQPAFAWHKPVITHLPYNKSGLTTRDPSSHFCHSYDESSFAKLHEARALACSGKLGIANDHIKDVSMFSHESKSEMSMPYSSYSFFKRLSGSTTEQPQAKNVWTNLEDAFAAPDQCDLNQITTATRKHKGIVSLAHISLMARMKGKDEAVLKLLDHIRSEEECELRAVAKALGQINTPRSQLELIAMLTRPNSTITVKQDIVGMLSGKDLSSLQNELRSAVFDITIPQNIEDPLFQIKDELAGMLVSRPESNSSASKLSTPMQNNAGEVNLDHELTGMIPHYSKLSSEVKRALRTALFFNKTIEKSQHLNSIDLSPLIDMQYKAMELLYREFFEDTVSNSLQKGAIQRKLDVIGYARPIVRQMDDFEAYVASLPVVRDIPFFSKFKLRKMLRAICQFEPGRRFTLDGLKAFGLYFLVFGRQNCKHGLAHIFPIGSRNDLELAEFCKELHVFQDFRNRAAHEGFHPDASNDVIGIWRTTASVVQWAFIIKDAQKSANQSLPHVKAS